MSLQTPPLTTTPIEVSDLRVIAQIHLAAFKASPLTALGRETVYRYYHWLLLGPHDQVALAVHQDKNILGFCFGGMFHGAFSGFVRKNRTFLILRVLTHPWLIVNPVFRERLSLSARVLHGHPVTSPKNVPQPIQVRSIKAQPSFGILAIATHPQYQKSGVGQLLMRTSEMEALRRGYSQMHLTVHVNNEKAIRFYEGLGWKKVFVDSNWKGDMSKSLIEQQKSTNKPRLT